MKRRLMLTRGEVYKLIRGCLVGSSHLPAELFSPEKAPKGTWMGALTNDPVLGTVAVVEKNAPWEAHPAIVFDWDEELPQ